MALLSWLIAPPPARATAPAPEPVTDALQVEDLPPDAAAAFGINTSTATITRREAMLVPAFARGRNLIAGTIGRMSLVCTTADRKPVDNALTRQPDPTTTTQWQLTWTVDDLLCYGIAWWHVLGTDVDNFPIAARRVHPHRVGRSAAGQPTLDGRTVTDGELIRFDGWHEGVLRFGATTLRAALALERATAMYADNPHPTGFLYDKRPLDLDAPDLSNDDARALVQEWDTASRTNPTRWLNRSTGYEALSWTPAELQLSEQRNQTAVQIARLLGLPSRQVNAPSESSSTYSTVQMDRAELVDMTLATYLTPISQRLSMDDVTRPGQLVDFDVSGFILGSEADRIANARDFVAAGLGDANEARQRYLNLPPTEGLNP